METNEITTEKKFFFEFGVILDSKEFFSFSGQLFSVSVYFCMFTLSSATWPKNIYTYDLDQIDF